MRKSFVAALAAGLCLFVSPALAGDRHSRVPVFNWTGFYVGGYVGGAWGDSHIRTDAGEETATSYFLAGNIDSINRNGSGSLGPDTAVGGAQIGFNAQHGKLVAGLEIDYGAFNLNGTRGATKFPYPTGGTYTIRAALDTDWLITARARLGWALQPNLIVYATGGLALTNLHVSNSFSDDTAGAATGGGSNAETMLGWTLGGGTELALSRQWSLKAEYLYVDFGSTTVHSSVGCGPNTISISCKAGLVTPNSFSTSADLSAHIARVGLNYKF